MKNALRFIQKFKNIYHLFQAIAANIWYGFPSKRLKVIGVTGTDGKTTTTHLIYHLLRQAGLRVSMISTVYAKVGEQEYDTGLHTTTPDPFLVQRMLKRALDNKNEYFVLETTSHAMDQNRVWGVSYEIGVLTNITHEHLDYHRDYDDYLKTKLLILKRSQLAIVNGDDESYQKIFQISKLKGQNFSSKLKTYGLLHESDYSHDFRKEFPRLASFNAYNYLAAYAVGKTLGIEDGVLIKALKSFKLPPGRIDIVYQGKFKVIVDFAHTPNAIKRILETVRETYVGKKGRIIHVFGSAGLRDSSKRPLMGEASAQGADITVLTEEDYRTEDPMQICAEIAAGLEAHGKKYRIIINREDAIKQAISFAKPGDIVVITGKGHEKSLCRGKTEYPWDDVKAVKELLSV